MKYLVKICGNVHPEDSLMVASAGPDFMGWIFSPKSPRRVELEKIIPIISEIKKSRKDILHAAVFAENSKEEILGILGKTDVFDLLQIAEDAAYIQDLNGLMNRKHAADVDLHIAGQAGHDERPAICPAIRVREKIDDGALATYGKFPLYVLDSYVPGKPGGTGRTLNTEFIKKITLPYLIAGGLNAENVQKSLMSCSAIGADVSSGIEDSPGRKNREKLEAFVKAVRGM